MRARRPRKRPPARKEFSEHKNWLLLAFKANGWDKTMVAEHRFHPRRMWRFDWAWPDRMVAVEYEGGIYARGHHVLPKGYLNDIDKYNAAADLGWKVFRVAASDSSVRNLIHLLKANLS